MTQLESPPVAVTRSARPRFAWFAFLLVLVNLVWAAQPTVVKLIDARKLGPMAIALLPFFGITLPLLPLLIASRRKPGAVKPTAADWGRFIIAGVAGQYVCQVGMNWGAIKGQASTCAILYLLIPVFTAVLASALLRERITPLRVLCLGIGLIGVLIMSKQDVAALAKGGLANLGQSTLLMGTLLFLGGCVGASFYNVYCKGLMDRFHERDILIYSYITACPAALISLLWLEPGAFGGLIGLDARSWAAMAFLTLFVYGISMLMFFYVLKFLPATVALTSTYLVPVFGVIIAVAVLPERPGPSTLIGAAVVLVATVLIMKYDPAVQ